MIRLLRRSCIGIVAANMVRTIGFAAEWSAEQQAVLQSLRIDRLGPLPVDASNRFADDPLAAALGKKIFFDKGFSANRRISCGSCHDPRKGFQEEKSTAREVGLAMRRTMPLAAVVYSPWLFRDGRKNSLWSQALGPLESQAEHYFSRASRVKRLAQHYRSEYEAIIGQLSDRSKLPSKPASPLGTTEEQAAWHALPEPTKDAIKRAFANLGKAIAAYERLLLPGKSRFDHYVEHLEQPDLQSRLPALDRNEIAGLRLFTGKAHCIECHNGPLFTDHDFHNTGVPRKSRLPENLGRHLGAQKVLADTFNCQRAYSDAPPDQCLELRFMRASDTSAIRAYKPPSLRNAASHPPYMHSGQFSNLDQVLRHYNRAPRRHAG